MGKVLIILFIMFGLVSIGYMLDNNAFAINLGSPNAGIGTSTPQTTLHIVDAGVSAVRMEETTGNKIWIFGNDFTNFNNAFTIWNPSAGFALLMDHTTGNVGLGTTSPQERLDVNGNIRLNGNILSAGGDICIGTCP